MFVVDSESQILPLEVAHKWLFAVREALSLKRGACFPVLGSPLLEDSCCCCKLDPRLNSLRKAYFSSRNLSFLPFVFCMNDPLLTLLQTKARYSDAELAEVIGLSPEEIKSRIEVWEQDGAILGYQAVTDPDKLGDLGVSAFIEVKVTPERGGGFDRLAVRVARFDQVVSCYLASGGYDLLVVVKGKDLREVASFVSDKLSTLDGVLSTATHFRLKAYKENGFIFNVEEDDGRLSVAP